MCEAPFAVHLGLKPISIKLDEVIVKLELKEEHKNSHGIAHGGVIYSLADHTFAFASNIESDATGFSSNFTYYRPAIGKELIAKSRKINESKSTSSHEVSVYCEDKLIASGTFIAFKVKR